jgi:menaquinone-dependent protoporphyrinogen oxidase
MKVLVAYATRHGATKGIAERIAGRLQAAGLSAEAVPAGSVRDISAYDAFVIGGAAYMFRWHKEAVSFVSRHRTILSARPVWLFSSGPLGTDTIDAEGRSVRETTVPREFPELIKAIEARGYQVFYGALDLSQPAQGIAERLTRIMPAAKSAPAEGDFRDWAHIDAWAAG